MVLENFGYTISHIKNNIECDLEWFEDKKILITGATGLLGINLMLLLKSTKYNFKCVLNYCNEPEKFFLDIMQKYDDRFECVRSDLTNIFPFAEYFFGEGFDIIFHFATYGQPSKIFTNHVNPNQLKTIKLNTEVVNKLFRVLKDGGKFIFMSTSEVYNGLGRIVDENDIGSTKPDDFRGCYIESKRCGEAICNYYKNVGFDVKIIRLCLGYGAGVKLWDKRALNNFIYNGLVNNKIELLDKGEAVRTYCYISDVMIMMR